jgi:YggT family protein
MLSQIATLLVDLVAAFFVYALLARFHMQWLRVPFRNPIGQFVLAVTSWMVAPARRIIPSLAGLDLASLLLAWAIQCAGLWAITAIAGRDLALAALAAYGALELVRLSLHILVFAVVVQAILSWVQPYSPVQPAFDAMTRPFLAPIRRFLPALGGIDLAPLVLLVVLQILFIPLAELRAYALALA